jgi:hypothetical protein
MALSHCLDVVNYWILQCVLIVDAHCCVVLLLSLALPFAQDPGATSALPSRRLPTSYIGKVLTCLRSWTSGRSPVGGGDRWLNSGTCFAV